MNEQEQPERTVAEWGLLFLSHWKQLLLVPLGVGLLALGISFAIAPTFTSRVTFLAPQQQQSAAASAIASLGALSGLAGMAAGVRSPSEQYVALLQSVNVVDSLIERFGLQAVYDEKFRVDARKEFFRNVRVSLGKKDGLITVEVDDKDPARAAAIANQHVVELRRLTSELALTEAQQRRQFFEAQLEQTKTRLTAAQQALEGSGFDSRALRAEPRAAAEGYARLRAELTASEVRLQALRGTLADAAPEVQQALASVAALRAQMAKAEGSAASAGGEAGADYVGKYREFKYQEVLFDLFARQFELARVDESREGMLIQVVDTAQPAERKTKPKRATIAAIATAAAFGLVVLLIVGRTLLSDARRPRPAP
jgi:capsule polysaccharide export protein KpsE/RkpR